MLHILCALISVVMLCCLVVMALVMNNLVLTRYVFSHSPPWTEELTRFLMVWMVMLGGAVLVLFDDHIALHLIADKLGRRGRLVQSILIRAIIAAVSALTAWTGFGYALSMRSVLAPGLGTTLFWPTFSVPLSMSLITVFALYLIGRDLADLAGARWRLETPRQADFMDGSFRPAEDIAGDRADADMKGDGHVL
ncbi:MAG: TRAP transporter small permease [Tropicimonas sp.]|uniref:TRAP transporter small permease n=1 Tax=Tropicimonas sp. TaxID=2067044 RepID=UPI003A8A951A